MPPDASLSIAGTVLVAVVSSSIASVLAALVVWWRKSAVEEVKAQARDDAHAAELSHFRGETDRIFGEMRSVLNGFGQRLDVTAERQGKLWNTMFGALETNGVHGDVKKLLQSMAALSAKVGELSSHQAGMQATLAQHGNELAGIGRRLRRDD